MKYLARLTPIMLIALLPACGDDGATGPAGPGVTWQQVTGTSVQAESNTGYLVDNAAQVTVTLPTAPAVGDIVQVSGIGSGGWKIAQNDGQSVITTNLPAIGVNWTARASIGSSPSVASSADGMKLVAAGSGRQIYTSNDFGVNWTARETVRNWKSVASSADGTKLAAVVDGGLIYTSANSGVNWTARETARNWKSVASSADGTKLAAVVDGGRVYTSTDSGVNWTPRGSSGRRWWSIASSADGAKLVVVDAAVSGRIYTSTDSGVNWTPRGPVIPTGIWRSVASSTDGTKLVASSWEQIYTSTDSGVNWTLRQSGGDFRSVASSADGTKLVAAVVSSGGSSGWIYTSDNSGVNWKQRVSSGVWSSVASSADGARLVAAVDGGQIFTSEPTPGVVQATTTGTAGYISGGQYDAIGLQYIGGNTFVVLSYAGSMIVQ